MKRTRLRGTSGRLRDNAAQRKRVSSIATDVSRHQSSDVPVGTGVSFIGALGSAISRGSALKAPSRDHPEQAHDDGPIEAALGQPRSLLRGVLDLLPVGVWIVDATGHIVYGNPAGQRIWGGARFVGLEQYGEYKGWWPRNGRRIEPEEWVAARAIAKGESTIDEEIEIECFDGSRKDMIQSAVPIFGSNREILGAIVLNQDITERKRAESALQRSAAELEETQRIGVVGSWTLHASDQFSWSEETSRIFGTSTQTIRPNTELFFALIHPDDRTPMRDWVHACQAGEQPGEIEYRIIRPDGGIRLICGRGALVHASDGSKRHIAGTAQDITDRKRVEAERERLLTALDQAGEMVFTTRPDGTIEYVNAAFEKITGYSRCEVIGKSPRMLNSGSQDAAFYLQLWNTISAGKLWRGRMVNRRKDGSQFVQDATISPTLDVAGRVVNFVAVTRDITEQLQQDERLLAAQKMEAIGTLAGGVAHDFNNLLSVILGYTRFAISNLQDNDSAIRDLEEVVAAGERAAVLTRQLLAFSRKQMLEPRAVRCNDIVEGIASMLRRLIGENIELETRLDSELGLVLADPGQIEQVIMNLAVNSRDALPQGGTLTIETRNISLEQGDIPPSGATPGHYVGITVTDNGCGMDEATLQRMFEPFFTTKPKDKGTGLGLSIVYGIIRQSGGFVDVESTLGIGTKVKLMLPRRVLTGPRLVSTHEDLGSYRGSECVLVVEDEPAVRRSTVRILRAAGYHVLEANNGSEALLKYQGYAGEIQLLLTDVVMPQMSGVQLAKRLVDSRPTMRVLFMSGYPDDTFGSIEPMAVDGRLINKPFGPNELERKVRQVLDDPAAG